MKEKKLALSEDILMSVEKAARYIGNEIHSVHKNPESVDIRFVMCFPDVYEIGMSHLGIQILYDQFNKREDVWCERVYSPWMDLHCIMKEKNIPLFALESQDPIKEFDFLGITLQYEMCYTNVLQILDLSHIPLFAKDRKDSDPIVIGGGPCTYNPEPLCDFFDLFYIGEGEISYDELFDLYKQCKKEGGGRKSFLLKAAGVPGIYVPSLYETTYNEDGTIASFRGLFPEAPQSIKRQVVTDFENAAYPMEPVIPFVQATQDRAVLEIMRGCIRGCRFCQAGFVYRPCRQKPLSLLKEYARTLMDTTGYEEISLSSLSSSDYEKLPELISFLIDTCHAKKVNISLPSLRIDAFSLDVMQKVQDVKKTSLTFAPEAGTQRLRNVINKGLTKEDILSGSELAFKGGWNKVKLYFMLGLPTETDEDALAIPRLGNDIAALYYDTVPKENRNGRCQISMSTSFFVPKPFTPFQWARMCSADEYKRRARLLKEEMHAQLNHKSLHYQWHPAELSVLEGVLARGDRRLSAVLKRVYELGAVFDAWSEYFDIEKWEQAFKDCEIDPDFYVFRNRSTDEILPWDFIDIGVNKEFLKREWNQALEEKTTKNCRQSCSGCGCREYNGGVCINE